MNVVEVERFWDCRDGVRGKQHGINKRFARNYKFGHIIVLIFLFWSVVRICAEMCAYGTVLYKNTAECININIMGRLLNIPESEVEHLGKRGKVNRGAWVTRFIQRSQSTEWNLYFEISNCCEKLVRPDKFTCHCGQFLTYRLHLVSYQKCIIKENVTHTLVIMTAGKRWSTDLLA